MDENIKIASMTVTEGGYFISPSTGVFDPEHDAIQQDAKNPDDPQTVFGLIVQALKKRKENGMKPFTVMSCDNVPKNGVARLMNEDLADWIDQNVTFPCSMVRQWVIEENFFNDDDKPALDKVGATFVDDVTPWKEAKLRILNAGHACQYVLDIRPHCWALTSSMMRPWTTM